MLKSKYKKIEHTPVVPRLVVEDTEVLVRKSVQHLIYINTVLASTLVFSITITKTLLVRYCDF